VELFTSHLRTEDKDERGHVVLGVDNEHRTSFQPFYFTNLKVCEEVDELNQGSDGLGTIDIEVSWLQYKELSRATRDREIPTLKNQAVHEKSKKLTSHRVLLGDSVPQDNSFKPLFKTTTDRRFAPLRFHFHYASRDLLMARDIMPDTKPQGSLTGLTSDRPKKRASDADIIDLEDEQSEEEGMTKDDKEHLKRLQAKAARAESRRKRVKTEVKSEPSTSPFKVIAGGVIDLTDD